MESHMTFREGAPSIIGNGDDSSGDLSRSKSMSVESEGKKKDGEHVKGEKKIK